MSFDVLIGRNAKKYLPENLPSEFKEAIRSVLRAISDAPLEVSRVPPCPPFVPHGRLTEKWVDFQSSRYMLRIFFEVDANRKQVGVTHISVQPQIGTS